MVEATVEENVQRLSSQRAAAMDLSAAVATRGKQAGQQEPLTVRYVNTSRTGHCKCVSASLSRITTRVSAVSLTGQHKSKHAA